MKRLLACILVISMAFTGIAASKASKIYDNAIDLMSAGSFEEAAALFEYRCPGPCKRASHFRKC